MINKYLIIFGRNKRTIRYTDRKTAVQLGLSPLPSNQISHIFFYLREHMELTADPEYRRLYKEILNYMIRYGVVECGYDPWQRRRNRINIEIYANAFNSYAGNQTSKYTKEQVDEFLDYRRKIWYRSKKN